MSVLSITFCDVCNKDQEIDRDIGCLLNCEEYDAITYNDWVKVGDQLVCNVCKLEIKNEEQDHSDDNYKFEPEPESDNPTESQNESPMLGKPCVNCGNSVFYLHKICGSDQYLICSICKKIQLNGE